MAAKSRFSSFLQMWIHRENVISVSMAMCLKISASLFIWAITPVPPIMILCGSTPYHIRGHVPIYWRFMMTSSNGKNFRVTRPLCGEVAGYRVIPFTKASDREIWFFYLRIKKGSVNTRDAGDWRRYSAHYGVIVMLFPEKQCKMIRTYCSSFYVARL